MKRIGLVIVTLAVVGVGIAVHFRQNGTSPNTQTNSIAIVEKNPAVQSVPAPSAEKPVDQPVVKPPESAPLIKTAPSSLLEAVDHEVPFTAQAPTANWDAFHEDACEEASAIMVWHYFNKTGIKSKDQIEQELADAAAWERAHVGTDTSVPASDAVRMLKEHFKLDADVIPNVTIEKLKTELSQNHLIILPAGGRDLHNPNFKSPGPLYHMLVVRGYDGSGRFITNDPGTRNGEKYTYDPKVLLAAIHDWNNGDVENGAKTGIVIRGVLQ